MRKLLILLGFLFSITQLFANDYDLRTVLKMAEENNKQIQLAQADLKTAAAEKSNAFAAAFPQIDVNAGYNRNLKENIFYFVAPNPITGELEIQSFQTSFKNEFRMTAVLKQTLFSFQVGYAIQAAKYFDQFTNYNYENIRRQIFTRVKTAFYGCILLKEALTVAEDSEASAKDNYENIKIKYESGIASEFELLQAEVRWQNSITRTIAARRDSETALNNLKMLIGAPIDEPMTLTGNIVSYPELPDMPAFGEVTEKRPDYNALLWEQKLHQKNVSIQKANYYPTLEGSFAYSYAATSDQYKLEQANDNFVLGLSLQIPIFSGGSTRAQVRKARADEERVTTRIAEANDNIRVELQNIQLRLREAMQRIQATEKAVQSARRAFEIAETRVDNGLSTQVELKDSRVALDTAQIEYLRSIYDYLSAYFEWELATGTFSLAETQ
jgi:outer membrane protein TolC